MSERELKLKRICTNIEDGNYTGDPHGCTTIAGTLHLKYRLGGRDHPQDYLVLVHDGYYEDSGYYEEGVFTRQEVDSICRAFAKRKRDIKDKEKSKIFDSIVI
ncbi:hypothetical protein 65p244 [Aeromonas phage 65]|uniref:Uncharacterized protein n=2 Tax=Ishigurovirus osborne TaxID=260149 RepID=A0A219YCF5_9CAUD|nr:hypothetical protein ST65p244 [Aeromonas phage 65]ADQ53252.1 hypothetical protein 65p244 [Aeromonas phage 65]APU01627.1 hypothetical protein [Aeromonas phage 65.2]